MKKEYRDLIIKIVISFGLLTYLYSQQNINELADNLKNINLYYVPLIVLLLILNYVVSSFRWKALLIFKNCEKVSVKYLVGLYFKGAFFNNFMPTSIGGDVYKVFVLGKRINNTVDAFSATFMERFTGVIALALISVIGLIKLLGIWGVLLLIAFLIGLVVGFYILSFLSTKNDKLKKIYDSLVTYRGQTKVLFWAFITSFFVQFLAIATQYLIFIAMNVEFSFFYALFAFPVITLASFFIPSINGLGVQDFLYKQLLVPVGISTAVIAGASVMYHLFRLGVSLIGGVIYVLGKDPR